LITDGFHKKLLKTRQSGGSLLATLIALVVTIIVIVAYASSYSNKAFMSKQLNSQQQFEDLNQLIATSIVSTFNDNIDKRCLKGKGGVAGVYKSIPISEIAKLKFTKYPKPGDLSHKGSPLAATVDRCKNVFEQDAKRRNVKHYHFCLELEKDPNAPRGAFSGSDFGLIEVTIEPISAGTGKALACTYLDPPSADALLRVSYRAYWAQTNTAKNRYFKRDGQFIAAAKRD
jgi:hypothetical protein